MRLTYVELTIESESFYMKNSKNRNEEKEVNFSAGSSNRRLKYPNLLPSTKMDRNFRVSIDRITLIAPLSLDAWEKHYYKWLRLPFVKTSGAGLQVLDYSHCDVDDFGNPHEHVDPEQVAYIEVPRFQKDKVRIDFNPNHGMNSEGGLWLWDLLTRLPNKKFSRADIAIDIFDHPEIKDYEVWDFGISKRIFLNKSGEMETTYWGKASSRRQIRLYNKKVEQEARHGKIVNLNSWWRLEMQLRGSRIQEYPELIKEMLEHFYIPDYKNPNLKINEQNYILRMKYDPNFYGNQTKQTKYRLRGIIKKAKPIDSLSLSMAQVFDENLSNLEAELRDYLGRYSIN